MLVLYVLIIYRMAPQLRFRSNYAFLWSTAKMNPVVYNEFFHWKNDSLALILAFYRYDQQPSIWFLSIEIYWERNRKLEWKWDAQGSFRLQSICNKNTLNASRSIHSAAINAIINDNIKFSVFFFSCSKLFL